MAEEWHYTAATMAAALGVSVGAIYQAVRAGHLPRRYAPIALPPRGNKYMLVFTQAEMEHYRTAHLGRAGRPQKQTLEAQQ